MTKLLGSKKGQVSVIAMLVGAAVVAGSYLLLQKSTDKLNLVQGTTNDWKLDLLSKKASMLGSYLVSNSLILCKEEGFSGSKKCIWGGNSLASPKDLIAFGLTAVNDVSDKNLLTYNFAVVEGALTEALPSGKSVQISFDLVDWQNDKDLKSFIGEIPNEVKTIDNDTFVVLMRVRVPFKPTETSKDGGYYETFAFIKRPLAIPKLIVESAQACAAGCPSSIGENPFPECRGKQVIPEKSVSSYGLTFVNTGPGPIYKAAYKRLVTYPDNTPPKESSLPLMAGMEFIMPGQSIKISDIVECYQPTEETTNKTVSSTVAVSMSRCRGNWTADCNKIWNGSNFEASGQSSTSNPVLSGQHLNRMADVSYAITPGSRLTSLMALQPNKSTSMLPSAAGAVNQLVREYTTTTTVVNYVPTH